MFWKLQLKIWLIGQLIQASVFYWLPRIDVSALPECKPLKLYFKIELFQFRTGWEVAGQVSAASDDTTPGVIDFPLTGVHFLVMFSPWRHVVHKWYPNN